MDDWIDGNTNPVVSFLICVGLLAFGVYDFVFAQIPQLWDCLVINRAVCLRGAPNPGTGTVLSDAVWNAVLVLIWLAAAAGLSALAFRSWRRSRHVNAQ